MAAVDAARDGQTALALRLAKHLAPADASVGGGKNVAFSPVSVHAALALVAAGSRGATLAQLLAFLGAPSAADLGAFLRRVTDSVLADRADTGGPRVLFGGGVWIDASRGGLNKAFRDVAAESYKSEARTVSFTKEPEEAVEMINNWVKKATNNLIDSILSPEDITADTDIVLANAVYFKGRWLETFGSSSTMPGTFHRLDGSRVEAEFMSRFDSDSEYVSCMDGFKVLRLPYMPGLGAAAWKEILELREWNQPFQAEYSIYSHVRKHGISHTPLYLDHSSLTHGCKPHEADDTQYSMFVFLPDERRGFATMLDVITAAPGYLYSVLPRTKADHVLVKLPKFEITFDWDLENDLRRLGLTLPFSPKVGDLRGMCEKDVDDGRPTFLSKVAHTAVIKVNEEGTEAVAVMGTVSGGGLGPPPDIIEFVADHPFTFVIMEERSGVIVFAGHVLNPTK